MITQIFSEPTFLIVNSSMMISYGLLLLIFKFAFIQKLSQRNKLALSRFIFVFSILSFLIMPYIISIHPVEEKLLHTPILKHTSPLFDIPTHTVSLSFIDSSKNKIQFSLRSIISIFWFIGFFMW